MKVEIKEGYLNGEDFYDYCTFSFEADNAWNHRNDMLQNIVKGKRIIHLGAADHKMLIAEKIKKNTYLQKILNDAAEMCIGLDINKDSVKEAQRLGIKNIYCMNMLTESSKVLDQLIVNICKNEKIDYLICGEMLEHIDDPVSFLKQLNEIYSPYIDKIVITVPNAFRFANIKNSLLGKEAINTDHRYWFTPYTLCKVVSMAGMKPKVIEFAGKKSGKTKLFLSLFKNNICYENIILIAKFINNSAGMDMSKGGVIYYNSYLMAFILAKHVEYKWRKVV